MAGTVYSLLAARHPSLTRDFGAAVSLLRTLRVQLLVAEPVSRV